jgi:hypothetical protein
VVGDIGEIFGNAASLDEHADNAIAAVTDRTTPRRVRPHMFLTVIDRHARTGERY